MKQIKTAEELLDEISEDAFQKVYRNEALDAMRAYAEQFIEAAAEEIPEWVVIDKRHCGGANCPFEYSCIDGCMRPATEKKESPNSRILKLKELLK